MSELPTPTPPITPETETFWNATTEGRLLLRRCNDCEKTYHYPRTICPVCYSDETTWVDSTGRGKVYSYTVIRLADGEYEEATPYIFAYIELHEGPRIMTNIVDCDPADVEIGQEVQVVFDDVNDSAALYRFVPRE